MNVPPQNAALSPVKQALAEIRDLRVRLAAAESSRREPIAIVGMGMRFPGGVRNGESYAKLLWSGRDAVTEIPLQRWSLDALYASDPDQPGKMTTRHGAFLEDVDQFDAEFFGISPREAATMDPQQRMILEVGWEALEDLGRSPMGLSGASAGVYLGIANSDYARALFAHPERIDAHSSTGTAFSVAAGRLSYYLGLRGPSVAIDTACSSSLVAVHLACQALRLGECDLALAGGVNLILTPEMNINFSKARMMAADGRCKTFDAAADGYVRGEGCALIVLRRLTNALADGDRVLAVIKGSAINQDGRSAGLTAPNGPAQEAVIRAALVNAGVEASAVSYVETHGTGTPLGDPIEAGALGSVFKDQRDEPLLIGSVKTNFGHLEAAAGIAGLIKVVESLRRQAIPQNLHFRQGNPLIEWRALNLAVPTQARPWIPIAGRRIAGVSAFGFSGTNAHVVVQEAPADIHLPAADEPKVHLCVLSARSPAALAVHAGQYAVAAAGYADRDLANISYTANFGRSHFSERAAVIARSVADLSDKLAALAQGDALPGVKRASLARRAPPRVAFIFTGQGSQYSGMARRLHESFPAFRDAFDRCAALLAPYLSRPLYEVVFGDGDARGELDNTGYTQPALFAVEYALAETWRSLGVTPNIVAGHSVGEIVAATVAGVFSLEDGIRLIAKRGALMAGLPAGGAMAAIAASEEDIDAAIALHADVTKAAVNGPAQTIISGAVAAIDQVCASFASKGVRCQKLAVSHAFHSPLMDHVLDPFERELFSVTLATPRLPLVSNLTGRIAQASEITQPLYWRRHLREPVRFGDCVNTIAAYEPDCIVEIGPHPALLPLFRDDRSAGPKLIASLRKGRDDWEQLLEGVSALFLSGAEIDWRGLARGERREIVDLPTYPFQRQRYWFPAKPLLATIAVAGAEHHPLLGRRLASPLPQTQFESQLSATDPAFIGDHRLGGVVVMPGVVGIEMAVAAAADRFGAGQHAIEDIVFREAMIFTEGSRILQTTVDPVENGTSHFQIQSKAEFSDEWTLNYEGWLRPAATASHLGQVEPFATIMARCHDDMPVESVYERFRQNGTEFGPEFRVLRELKTGAGEAWGRIELHEKTARDHRVGIHPVVLDGSFQVAAAMMLPDTGHDVLYLLVSVQRFRAFSLRAVGDEPMWS